MFNFSILKNSNHKFYKLTEKDIKKAEERLGFAFPDELKAFYQEVGYGFLDVNNKNSFNRMLDPHSVADIRLREGIYEYDPDLDDIYEEEDELVFYEVNEGVYLTMDLKNKKQSSIYYLGIKIANSFAEFLKKINEDTDYFEDITELEFEKN
ncbi:SMI1/KNR4 family protein [Priestia endophytica]